MNNARLSGHRTELTHSDVALPVELLHGAAETLQSLPTTTEIKHLELVGEELERFTEELI